jgi:tetratricopeptide (TPR) repeat protein
MLESVRAFALESLTEANEEPGTRQRHASWFHGWVVSSPDLRDPSGLDRLETEHNNLRAAIAWADDSGESAITLELAGALARFWQFRGYVTEGRQHLERALATTPDTPSAARLRALSEAGTLANANGDYAAALTRFEAALAMAETLGDQSAVSAALNSIGGVVLADGDTARAESFFARSLAVAEAAGDRKRAGVATSNLGAVAHFRGDLETARAHYETALTISRELNDTFNIALATGNLLILLAPFPESHDEAIAYGQESLQRYDELGDHQGKGYAYDGLGTIAESRGDAATARSWYEQSLAQFRAAEDPSGIAKAIGGLGSVALMLGDRHGAAELLRESLRAYLELEERDAVANLLDILAEIALAEGAAEVAARLLGATDRLREELDVTAPAQLVTRRQATANYTRNSLGDEQFHAEQESGAQLTIEAAANVACSFAVSVDNQYVA